MWSELKRNNSWALVGGIVAFGVLLRAAVSLHSYSGEATPPMYGDFEAQRHWQEITVNLPIRDWYENTTDNDLLYWGLDYPPLTAYHSFVMGLIARYINPSYVELHESRGLSDPNHKHFMRCTVLAADVLVYISSLVLMTYMIFQKLSKTKIIFNNNPWVVHLVVAVFYPGQILIDNGHFQYNNISLGLACFAVTAILCDNNKIASLFFVLALNYKQMELYHALPFFCYLLSVSLRDRKGVRSSFASKILRLVPIGVTVIVTFIVIWLPWIGSWSHLQQVVHRIFPIARGVFEDKVSNVWCLVNIFIKIKENFTNEFMARLCLTSTAAAILPSSINLLIHPTKHNFLLSLINSSLAFFLFSFQVHEKSILIVALPIIIYYPVHPTATLWFLLISTFSMFPLLLKDNQLLPFVILTAIYLLLQMLLPKIFSFIDSPFKWKTQDTKKSAMLNFAMIAMFLSILGSVGLMLGYLWVPPPESLPFLWPFLVSAYSCVHFVGFFIYFNYLQLYLK